MKRITILAACVLSLPALTLRAAESPGQEFVAQYSRVQQADQWVAGGREREALDLYLQAYKGLRALQKENPGWNPGVVSFRVDDTAGKILDLQKKYPATVASTHSAPAKVETATPPATLPAVTAPAVAEIESMPAATEPATATASGAEDPETMAELRILRDQVDRLRLESNDSEQVESLQRELAGTRQELAEQTKLVAVMNDEADTLLKDLIQYSEDTRLPELTQQNEALRSRISELQLQMARSSTTSAASEQLFSQVNSLQFENQSLRARNAALQEQAGASANSGTLQADVDQARGELAAARDRAARLEEENRRLSSLMSDRPARIEVGDTQGSVSLLEQRNAELQQQKQALEARLASLSAITPGASASPVAPTDDGTLERLRNEIASLKEQNQLLGANTSAEPASARDKRQIDRLEQERDELRAQLKLADKASRVRDAHKIEELGQERDYFERQLKEANLRLTNRPDAAGQSRVDELNAQVQALQAKIAALEARPTAAVSAPPAATISPAPAPVAIVTPTTVIPPQSPANADAPKLEESSISPQTGALLDGAERAYAGNDLAGAEAKYQAAATETPGNLVVLSNLAATQIEQDRLTEAEGNIRKVLEATPNDSVALFQLGYIQYRRGDYAEAIQMLDRAAGADPQDSEIQNYRGIVLSSQGKRDDAEAAFRKALILAPGNGSAHHNLAVLYATQSPALPELADWHYGKALEAGHPRNEDLERKIAELRSASK